MAEPRSCEYSYAAISGYECVESDFQWPHYESCPAKELIQKHLLPDAVAAKCVCGRVGVFFYILCSLCQSMGTVLCK